MYAIIQTGGKQYKVEAGDEILVEKLDAEVNAEVEFDVLLVADDAGVKIGTPVLDGVKAKAKVVEHGKGKKVIVFKYKPKKNIRTKRGHRQPYTKVEILSIG
ncbi:MAG: 50S ribosomal protein L21 [Clostridium sp.]|nr:50S ribosomal protein L21 [Clostridium sp.]MDD7138849.1 50S ribosomal protein L21 [Clostridium sp.]MDY6081716.1 50S ribosomal protein L21 [Eubacteriales bacterium]